jgi:phosphomannomutase
LPRRYFGTDGVRGIVGEKLTPELVEGSAAPPRSGRAAAAPS